MRVLFAPFRWLRVSYPGKCYYDWLLPLLVGVLAALVKDQCGDAMNVFGARGLLEHVLSLLLILTGFFIAALGVVSAMRGRAIDQIMVGDKIARLGGVPITRRRYLALMFGYLALSSLLLYIGGTVANLLAPISKSKIPIQLHAAIEVGFAGAYMFMFANVTITTMIGLYYLSDRLYREGDKKTLKDGETIDEL